MGRKMDARQNQKPMTYTVYFEIYGKKLKTEVEAKSIEQAKYVVASKIIWHKVEPKEDDAIIDRLSELFGTNNPFKK